MSQPTMTDIAVPADQRGWSAFHVFAHGSRTTTDHAFVECSRAARELTAAGQASAWFVMRYWEGGPHVRVRLRDLRADAASVRATFQHIAATAPEQSDLDPASFYGPLAGQDGEALYGWHGSGTVTTQDYQPEYERYGGADLMSAGEDMFQVSSELAYHGVRAVIDGQSRLSLGTTFVVAYAAGLLRAGFAAEDVATGLRRYGQNFARLAGAPSVDVRAQIDRAERSYSAAGSRLRAALNAHQDEADAPSRSAGSIWSKAVAGYTETVFGDPRALTAQLRELDADQAAGAARDLGRRWGAVGSQWHMLANRLGLSVADEVYLTWLASLAVLDAPGSEAMHDPTRSQARAWTEASKFRRGDMTVTGPVKSSARTLPTAFGPGVAVTLPPPDTSRLGSLTAALQNRRSAYGSFEGIASLDELSTVLHAAAAVHLAVEGVEADHQVTVERTTYPRAGGVGALRLDVTTGGTLTSDVSGHKPLPAGRYTYDPSGHQLMLVGPDNRSELALGSPYTEPNDDGAVAVDLAHAAVAMTIHLDARALGWRYGQRALRFALLEAGHLAQNLVLVASSIGWKSITIGGFYDDEVANAAGADGINTQPLYIIPFGSER